MSTHNWSVIDDFERGGLWHYTSRTGLRGIVENHCLWATARTGLNDPTEVTYALDELRSTWQHYRSSSKLVDEVPRDEVDHLVTRLGEEIESHDLFFASGSMFGDKLEHWKEYGRDEGYAICLQEFSIWRIRSRADEIAPEALTMGSLFCGGTRWTIKSSSPTSQLRWGPRAAAPSTRSSGRS